MMSELVKPYVKDPLEAELQVSTWTMLDNLRRCGWTKDGNGVTYSVHRPEVRTWIKRQNPDMYQLHLGSYWFKNPELETFFLLRWG